MQVCNQGLIKLQPILKDYFQIHDCEAIMYYVAQFYVYQLCDTLQSYYKLMVHVQNIVGWSWGIHGEFWSCAAEMHHDNLLPSCIMHRHQVTD